VILFRKLRILSYHNIDDVPVDVKMPGLYVSQAEFARHMWTLRRAGLRGVTLSDALNRLQADDVGNTVAITFDDGYSDNNRYALPILRECGFRATCYIVSERIGKYNDWDSDYLGVRKPLMSSTEIQCWLDGGMEIGSHTRSHPRLDLISQSEAMDELTCSRESLGKLYGSPIAHFCYPFGRYDQMTPSLVRSAGYRSAATTHPGILARGGDLFQMPRIPVGPRTNALKLFAKMLAGR
jgi:peptidoglycan/xylan/chitin deacetylase (PgdA/CDA1 family)